MVRSFLLRHNEVEEYHLLPNFDGRLTIPTTKTMAIIKSIMIAMAIIAHIITTHWWQEITMPSAQYPVPAAQIKLFPCACIYCCVLRH